MRVVNILSSIVAPIVALSATTICLIMIPHRCEAFVVAPSSSSVAAASSCSSSLLHIQQLPIRRGKSTLSSSSRLYFFKFGGGPTKKKEDEFPTAEDIEPTTSKDTSSSSSDEPDLVEKIFTAFFGKPEESPFGLKRFNENRFPELYPATVTEWASPVEGDDKDVAKLRPLLKNTNLETRRLRVAYSANRDGWRPEAFHAKVDRNGPSLVVATTSSGKVVGGYNPKGWVSYGEARGSIAAFLFVQSSSTSSSNSPSGGSWIKLRKVGGPGLAQLDYPESGPSFGADALVIPLNTNSNSNPKVARSKLGSYYERFPDGTNSLFGAGQASATLKDLKVYQGVYAPGEFIPFTDAEPFALY